MAITLGGRSAGLGKALGTGISQNLQQNLDMLQNLKTNELLNLQQQKHRKETLDNQTRRASSAWETIFPGESKQTYEAISEMPVEKQFQLFDYLYKQRQQQGQGQIGPQFPQQQQQNPGGILPGMEQQGQGQMQGQQPQQQQYQPSPFELPQAAIARQKAAAAQSNQQATADYRRDKLNQTKELNDRSYTESKEKESRDYYQKLKEKSFSPREASKKAKEVIDIVNSGEANIGAWGGLKPSRYENDATQRLNKLLQQLVVLADSVGDGARSNKLKLQLRQLSKPELRDSGVTIEGLAHDIIESADKLSKDYYTAKNVVKDRGYIPGNLQDVVAVGTGKTKKNPNENSEEVKEKKSKRYEPELSETQKHRKNQTGIGRLAEAAYGLVSAPIKSGLELLATAGKSVDVGRAFRDNAENFLGRPLTAQEKKQFDDMDSAKPFVSELHELEKKYLPADYGKPRGTVERIIQDVAKDLPFMFTIPGVSLAGSIGRSVASNTVAAGARGLGLGKLGEAASGATAGILFEAVRGGFNPRKLRKLGETIYKKDYPAARKAAQSIPKQVATDVEKHIQSDINKLTKGNSGLFGEEAKMIHRELKKVDNNINFGKLSVQDAWDQKRHLNKLLGSDKLSKEGNKYIKNAVGSLNGFLKETGTKFPKFGVPFERADDLYKGLHAPSKFRAILEKYTDLEALIKDPLAKTALLFQGVGKPLRSAAVAGGALAAREVMRTVDFLTKSRHARQIYKDIFDHAATNDKAALATSLKHFNTEAENFSKSHGYKRPEKKKK